MSTRRNRDRTKRTTAALLALLGCLALAAPGWGQGGVILWGLDTEYPHGEDAREFVESTLRVFNRACNRQNPLGPGILVIGADDLVPDDITAHWRKFESETQTPVTFARGEAEIAAAHLNSYRTIVVATQQNRFGVNGGLRPDEHRALLRRRADLARFINEGGTLLGSYSDFLNPFGYLGDVSVRDRSYKTIATTTGISPLNPIPTGAKRIDSWRQVFRSFPAHLEVLATVADPGLPITGAPAAIGGCQVVIPPPCAQVAGGEPICSTDGSGDFTYTFEITNTGEETVHDLFLVRPTAGVSISPHYFDFSNNPICSSQQPDCSVDDATRSLTVTIRGAAPGDSVSFLVSLHDETVSECCSIEHTVELPDCECGQIVEDLSVCSLRFPPFSSRQDYTFTFQNLHPHVVDEVLIAPTNGSRVRVSPNVLSGLGLAAFPYTDAAGEHTETVTLTGRDAQAGREVCLRISAHDQGFQECCSVERCFTLRSCWDFLDDIHSVGDAELSVIGASFLRLSGIDAEGGDGLVADLDGVDGVEVGMLGLERAPPNGAYWSWSGGSEEGDLFALRVEDVGADLAVVPDGPASAMGRFEIRHRGLEVAAGDLALDAPLLVPDDAWRSDSPDAASGPKPRIKVRIRPTLVQGKPGIRITITFAIAPAPVTSGDGGTGPVVGDELIFVYEVAEPARPVLDRIRFLAAGIPEIVFTEIAGTVTDCNGNGVSDVLDVANGTSADADGSGVPDECEVAPAPLDLSLDTAFSEAAGGLVAPGAEDDDWRIVDGATSIPARRVMRKNRGWNDPLPGSDWISLDGRRGASAAGFETLLFERCFCLADSAHAAALEVDLFADDRATVLLNGEPIGGPGGRFDAAAPLSVRYHGHLGDSLFRAGENCLVVAVEDTGGVVTGLDLTGRVAAEAGACPPQP